MPSTISVNQSSLRNAMAYAMKAADSDSSRYAMNGVLLEQADDGRLVLVGCDGRRIHDVTIPAEFSGDTLASPYDSDWTDSDKRLPIIPLDICRKIAALPRSHRQPAQIIVYRVGVAVHAHKGRGSQPKPVTFAGDCCKGRYPRWHDYKRHDNVRPEATITGPAGSLADIFDPQPTLAVSINGSLQTGKVQTVAPPDGVKYTGAAAVELDPAFMADALSARGPAVVEISHHTAPVHVTIGEAFHACVMPCWDRN